MLELSGEQKRFFAESGYLVMRGFFTEDVVASWREEMAALLHDPRSHHRADLFTSDAAPSGAPQDPANPHRIWRIMDLPLLSDTWFKLACEPRIVGVMSDLLGPDINFHNGKAILKPPHFRRSFWGWHQDWPYERHTEPDLAAAIVYLHDMDENAGATEILPGSHRRGEWPHEQREGLFAIPPEQIGPEAHPVPVKAGDVLFIHVQVVHRAGNNETAVSRCGIINEYKTAQTRDLWGNRLAFAELPLVRGGKHCYRFGA